MSEFLPCLDNAYISWLVGNGACHLITCFRWQVNICQTIFWTVNFFSGQSLLRCLYLLPSHNFLLFHMLFYSKFCDNNFLHKRSKTWTLFVFSHIDPYNPFCKAVHLKSWKSQDALYNLLVWEIRLKTKIFSISITNNLIRITKLKLSIKYII